IEVVLLDVLATVAFARRQPEQPLLEDRILSVPERGGEDEQLIAIADRGEAVFAPAIRLAARLVVREIVPRVAVRAVVLAHRAPRPLRGVASPAPPGRNDPRGGLGQASMFSSRHSRSHAPRISTIGS